MKTGPKPRPLVGRLMSKVAKQPDGCWLWVGARYSSGYGVIKGEGKEIIGAHRASYIAHFGVIPPGMVVMHTCDVKLCVRPEHLKLGTDAENLADMRAKGRHSHGEAHSEALRKAWTPEMKAQRAKVTGEWRRARERQRRIDAGVPADWKYCGKSKHWLPRDAFTKNGARPDGLNNYCRECRSQRLSDLD